METTWKRWQDYATMLFGVLLFVAPFVFADTLGGSAAWTGYILGVLLFVAGVVGAAQTDPRGAAGVAVVLGILAFIAPWVLGFTGVAGMA